MIYTKYKTRKLNISHVSPLNAGFVLPYSGRGVSVEASYLFLSTSSHHCLSPEQNHIKKIVVDIPIMADSTKVYPQSRESV